MISWWIAHVDLAAPRRISLRREQPLILYTDAAGPGHVAAILIIAGKKWIFETHLPSWMLKDMGIFEFELVAVILGVTAAQLLFPGRPIFAFGDNTAVDHAAIRGSNKTRTGRVLCSILWAILSKFPTPCG